MQSMLNSFVDSQYEYIPPYEIGVYFKSESGPSDVRDLSDEIRRFLENPHPTLDDLFENAFISNILPNEKDGVSTRVWLNDILRGLASE